MGVNSGVIAAVCIGSIFAISLLLVVIYCFFKIKQHERHPIYDET
jgi:hypothetical protein